MAADGFEERVRTTTLDAAETNPARSDCWDLCGTPDKDYDPQYHQALSTKMKVQSWK